jgi:hypothetical protein
MPIAELPLMLAHPLHRTAVSIVHERLQSLAFLIAYLLNGVVSEVTALAIHIKEQNYFRILTYIPYFEKKIKVGFCHHHTA